MTNQSQKLFEGIQAAIQCLLADANAAQVRSACLIAASELVAEAARAVSKDAPGMPVVELILLSERIASLAEETSNLPE